MNIVQRLVERNMFFMLLIFSVNETFALGSLSDSYKFFGEIEYWGKQFSDKCYVTFLALEKSN